AMETTLEQLENDSLAGRTIRQELLTQIEYPQNFFPDNLRLNALDYLAVSSLEMTDVRLPPQEELYVKRLEQSDLRAALLSHVEVRSST
ncbi:hypothetical protein, partial [Salmonella enterica]|uniref:hypothetical protein n=1 Tax=Salmonella enterica TaxID=28901 RepID=UPI0021B32056